VCATSAGYLRGCLTYWFRGVLGNYVYELAILHKPEYCIAHWEAINIIVALRTFYPFLQHHRITIWCDNTVAVNILSSARGTDPTLQSIARNMWLIEASLDCEFTFSHIKGINNSVADLLSRWSTKSNPTAKLFSLLGGIPRWIRPPPGVLDLDPQI
jgi:hypothetical protein